MFNEAGWNNDPISRADAGNGFLFEQGYSLLWSGWNWDVLPGEGRLQIELPIATEQGKPITGPVAAEFVVAQWTPKRAVHVGRLARLSAGLAGGAGRPPQRARRAGRRAHRDPPRRLALRPARGRPAGARSHPRVPRRRVRAGPDLRGRLPGAGSAHRRPRPRRDPRRHLVLPVRARGRDRGGQPPGRSRRARSRGGADLRHLAVRPGDPAHAVAGAARGRGRAHDLRWRADPCRRRRQGQLQPPLRADHAPPQPSRGPAVSGRFLPVHHHAGARSGDRRDRRRARARARRGRAAAPVLHDDLDRVLDARGLAPAHRRHRQRGRAPRPARAPLLPRRRTARQLALPRAWPVPELRQSARSPAADARSAARARRLGDRGSRAARRASIPGSRTARSGRSTTTAAPSPKFPGSPCRAATCSRPASTSVRALPARGSRTGSRRGSGPPYVTRVPLPDADGNDLGGIRLPAVALPLGTYTGWNLRRPEVGAPDKLARWSGSFIPFAPTEAAQRAARRSAALAGGALRLARGLRTPHRSGRRRAGRPAASSSPTTSRRSRARAGAFYERVLAHAPDDPSCAYTLGD